MVNLGVAVFKDIREDFGGSHALFGLQFRHCSVPFARVSSKLVLVFPPLKSPVRHFFCLCVL